MSPVRRFVFLAGFAFGLWLFFRPRSVRCPTCGGLGAPPTNRSGMMFARICPTCGASSTPDLPIEPEHDASLYTAG